MTAEEFLIQYYDEGGDGPSFIESVREQMSEMAGFDFDTLIDGIESYAIHKAKYHVEQAISAIEQKGIDGITSWSGNPYTGEGSDYLDVEKMLDAYPEKNFK
jgi:hypothetical protein